MSTLKHIAQIEDNQEVKLYPKRGIALEKGEGVYVFDTNGKKYLDFMTNLGVNILGYTNPDITQAIASQLETLPSTHQSFYSESRAALLTELKEILPQKLNQIIFTNSGAESLETALKLAVTATGRSTFIATTNSYHGKNTIGSLSITGQQKYREPFLPLLGKVRHVPFNDIPALKKAFTPEIAAVILEPIQGETGIITPSKDYLQTVKELCTKHKVLLILDEIQSAIRTGNWFSFKEDSMPDILCLSKSFSYGIPFGLVVTTLEVGGTMPKGGHGGTFTGNPIACVAATEIIKKIKKDNLLTNARELGQYFLTKLQKIDSPLIENISGRGLWIGIKLTQPITPFLKKMQDRGLIAASSYTNTIRFLPPITVTKDEIDEAVDIIKDVIPTDR